MIDYYSTTEEFDSYFPPILFSSSSLPLQHDLPLIHRLRFSPTWFAAEKNFFACWCLCTNAGEIRGIRNSSGPETSLGWTVEYIRYSQIHTRMERRRRWTREHERFYHWRKIYLDANDLDSGDMLVRATMTAVFGELPPKSLKPVQIWSAHRLDNLTCFCRPYSLLARPEWMSARIEGKLSE